MLDGDKHKRKSPGELLLHPFIRMGEQFLQNERRLLEHETKIKMHEITEGELRQKCQVIYCTMFLA